LILTSTSPYRIATRRDTFAMKQSVQLLPSYFASHLQSSRPRQSIEDRVSDDGTNLYVSFCKLLRRARNAFGRATATLRSAENSQDDADDRTLRVVAALVYSPSSDARFRKCAVHFPIGINPHRIKLNPDAPCKFAVQYRNMAKWHL